MTVFSKDHCISMYCIPCFSNVENDSLARNPYVILWGNYLSTSNVINFAKEDYDVITARNRHMDLLFVADYVITYRCDIEEYIVAKSLGVKDENFIKEICYLFETTLDVIKNILPLNTVQTHEKLYDFTYLQFA